LKLLHCSDIHLGRRPTGSIGEYSQKRFEDYFRAFDQVVACAIDRGIEAVLVAGDLFDKRDLTPDVLERAEDQLRRLHKAAIPVVLTEGNHDKITGEETSWLVYLRNRGLVVIPGYDYDGEGAIQFRPETIGNVRFYGLGYSGAAMEMHICALKDVLDPGYVNIVLAHTAASPDLFFPGLVRHEDLAPLKGLARYMAGGHIHHRTCYPRTDPWFFTPGSTEFWDLDETGEKGFIIFDTHTGKHEFIETEKRRIVRPAPIAVSARDEDSFRSEFQEIAASITVTRGEDIVVLGLVCPDALYVDTAWCASVLEKRGALKAKVTCLTGPPPKSGAAHLTGIEETELEHIRKWQHFAPLADECLEVLQKMKILQEDGNYEDCRTIFDGFLNRLTGGGTGEN
jgi:DNA repair exonuclease SbcCD nuclease subunit